MELSKEDKRNFPRLAQYIRYRMPEVLDVGLIVNNIQTYGQLTRADFAAALTWGEPPLVKIVDLSTLTCGGVSGAYGCTRNDTEIELHVSRVRDFERDPGGKGSSKTKRGRNVYIVGVTILHELCHWGHRIKKIAEKGHSGLIFEEKTYGQIIY